MPASPWSAAVRANVFLAPGAQRDAAFRLRTSQPTDVFAGDCDQSANPLVFDEVVTGGGSTSYIGAQAAVHMQVTAAPGERVIRQSREYVRYLPGKSQMVMVSVDFQGSTANVIKRAGYFDDNSTGYGAGMYFYVDAGGIKTGHRVGASDTLVDQANWNVDKLNGGGPSGVTLDTTKPQTMVFVFGGMVSSVMRWGFILDGNIVICHEEFQTNTAAGPQMPHPSLPVRWELESTGGVGEMFAFSASVQSEGGFDDKGRASGLPRNAPLSLTAVGVKPLLSIRLKTSFKRGQVHPTSLSVLADGSENYYYLLLLRPTLMGATFATGVDHVEGDIAALGYTQGHIVGSGWGEAGKVLNVPLDGILLGADYAGTTDILTLAVSPVGTSPTDFYAAINWREFI